MNLEDHPVVQRIEAGLPVTFIDSDGSKMTDRSVIACLIAASVAQKRLVRRLDLQLTAWRAVAVLSFAITLAWRFL